MAQFLKGKISDVIFARLEPGEDLLKGIKQVAREAEIETGMVVDITGSLTAARVQKFKEVGDWKKAPLEVIEVPGPLEASGHGIIGKTRGSGGLGGYKDGEPYVHVHLALTSAATTLCGHLMEGCFVRSHNQISHFTIVLARVEGVRLTLVANEQTTLRSAKGEVIAGGVYHDLEAI